MNSVSTNLNLKDNYTLVQVDKKYYKTVTQESYTDLPKLLTVKEFKAGKEGLALFNHDTERLVFAAK